MADMKVVAGYKTLPRETDGARPGREGVNSSAGSTAAGVVGAVVAAFVAGVMAL